MKNLRWSMLLAVKEMSSKNISFPFNQNENTAKVFKIRDYDAINVTSLRKIS